MAKKMSPLGIMNLMGDAVDKKSKISAKIADPSEPDADDMIPAAKGKKSSKQVAAMKAKGK